MLDLASKGEPQDSARQKQKNELRSEALDYLVQIFSEDEKKGPKDVYDFLVTIGGETYSHNVIDKLATTFFNQARYDRAIEGAAVSHRSRSSDEQAPRRQQQIVESYKLSDDSKAAMVELHKLGDQ